jgi:hypothetical protein
MGECVGDACTVDVAAEIKALNEKLSIEVESNARLRKQIAAISEERDVMAERVEGIKGKKTLPLSASDCRSYQKRFDGLVLHSKQGLSDAFDVAESNFEGDNLEKIKKLRDRVKHELSWLRDNGAGLIQIVCLGGQLYAFSDNKIARKA